MPIQLRGTVQRTQYHKENGLPYMEHRTCNDGVWGWSLKSAEAHVFNWEDAEKHVTELKLQGEKSVFPFVRTTQNLEHHKKSSTEVFEDLEKRNLA